VRLAFAFDSYGRLPYDTILYRLHQEIRQDHTQRRFDPGVGIHSATPGTFQPSLQIDGIGAKLLIEALSGRWSYDTERREKRTVWYHVANAFSLLVSTMAPLASKEQIKVISNYDR
jgi:hypothetical protein